MQNLSNLLTDVNRFFDSGEANGLLFDFMPFVEGESPRARLERERELPVDEVVPNTQTELFRSYELFRPGFV